MNISSFIRDNIEAILQDWEDFARSIQPKSGNMRVLALRDAAKKVMEEIADELETSQSIHEQAEKSKGRSLEPTTPTAARHGLERLEAGFGIVEMISEYRALRASVSRLWNEIVSQKQIDVLDLIRFNEAIDQRIHEAIVSFTMEAELQTRQFDTVFSSSPDHNYILDRDGKFLYANRALLKTLHISLDELLGKSHFDLNFSEAPDLHKTVKKLIETTTRTYGEVSYCLPSGEVRCFEYVYTPVFDDDKRVNTVACTERDITDRKLTEDRLKRKEKLYRTLFSNSQTPILMVDEKSRSYIDANQAALDFMECTKEQLVGRSVYEKSPSENIEQTKKEHADFSEIKNLETYYRINNKIKILLLQISQLELDGDSILIGIGQDITERKLAEETLREQLDFSESLIETAQTIILVLDPQGRIVRFNSYMEDLVGYDLDEVKGKDWFETFIKPDNGNAVKSVFQEAVDDIQNRRNVNPIIAKDGRTILVEWHNKTLKDKDGRTVGILAIGYDITERKQAETYREMGREILQILNEMGDLRESIQRVLAVLKSRTGVDAVGLRLQKGEDFPYFVQDGFSKDFLLTENTLLQRGKDGGVCRDKDGNVRLECTCGLVISGKTDPSNPLFTQGGSSWLNDSFPLLDLPSDQDPRLHPRNNCIHQGYASVALIPVRTSDRIVGLIQLNDKRKGRFTLEMIEVLEVIAAHVGSALIRKQMEDELVEYSQRLQHATDSGKLAVWDWNVKDNIMFWDDRMFEFYGISRDSFPSNVDAWVNGLHPDDKQRAVDECNAALLGEKEFDTTFRVRHPEGTIKYIKATALVTRDNNGKAIRMIGINTDITEQSELEAERKLLETQLNQAQKMESVGRLAGGVAHDFNNMLGVILGHTEMALDEIDPSAPLYATLHAVQQAAERSSAITQQLLAFARKQTVAPKVIDINDTVEGMLNMLRRLIGEDIDLLWQPGSNLRPVKVDPSQIDQLLANLCVNARDAIAGVGKVTIETDAKAFDEDYCADHLGFQPGEYVLLEVSDDGCGIDKKTLNQIFEPFFTTKEQGKGTGLGLASVFGMVKQNNGFINVYSEPGQGTTIKIYLPAYAVKSDGVVEKAPNLLAKHGNETILLVEDESTILEMTKMMLTRLGYTVVAAATPGEAIRLAHEYRGRIDLLMTDVVMPEMNGRELAGNLLTHYPALKRLFMSGYTANVIAHHGVLDQGVHFIQKPFSKKDLGRKLREALEC